MPDCFACCLPFSLITLEICAHMLQRAAARVSERRQLAGVLFYCACARVVARTAQRGAPQAPCLRLSFTLPRRVAMTLSPRDVMLLLIFYAALPRHSYLFWMLPLPLRYFSSFYFAAARHYSRY